MSAVKLVNISKQFDESGFAVRGVNIQIKDGELAILVGPSGCGKSTILRMIAGLEEQTGGDVFIGDTCVNNLPPRRRDIAMVFQNYALYPHMSVYENLAFGLKLRHLQRDEIEQPSPEGNANGSPWGGHSCASHRSFSSMNRFPTWMPNCVPRCVPRSVVSIISSVPP